MRSANSMLTFTIELFFIRYLSLIYLIINLLVFNFALIFYELLLLLFATPHF